MHFNPRSIVNCHTVGVPQKSSKHWGTHVFLQALRQRLARCQYHSSRNHYNARLASSVTDSFIPPTATTAPPSAPPTPAAPPRQTSQQRLALRAVGALREAALSISVSRPAHCKNGPSSFVFIPHPLPHILLSPHNHGSLTVRATSQRHNTTHTSDTDRTNGDLTDTRIHTCT